MGGHVFQNIGEAGAEGGDEPVGRRGGIITEGGAHDGLKDGGIEDDGLGDGADFRGAERGTAGIAAGKGGDELGEQGIGATEEVITDGASSILEHAAGDEIAQVAAEFLRAELHVVDDAAERSELAASLGGPGIILAGSARALLKKIEAELLLKIGEGGLIGRIASGVLLLEGGELGITRERFSPHRTGWRAVDLEAEFGDAPPERGSELRLRLGG